MALLPMVVPWDEAVGLAPKSSDAVINEIVISRIVSSHNIILDKFTS
jgi:hypothetical protein